jgi:hypothetical protein
MTYDEWLAKYVRQVEVSAIPSMHGRDVHTTHYVFHVSGLGDPIFDSTWNHVHGAEPLTPAQVLDALCHDMVAVSVPFSEWEHGFDSDIDARRAYNDMRERRDRMRDVLGSEAFTALMECDA